VVGFLLLVAIAGAGYSAYAGTRVYQDLGSGRDHLVAGQVQFTSALKSGDLPTMRAAAVELQAADAAFQRGGTRLNTDLALRAGAQVPGSRDQVEAAAHLAAIGRDMALAASAAEQIAEGILALKQRYAGRVLTPADLAALAHESDALAQRYATAAGSIGLDLKAAHEERAQVTTARLVPPLRSTYDQVDAALAAADAAFLQFQDPKRILSEFLGLSLPF
jgi:hypothetical protein